MCNWVRNRLELSGEDTYKKMLSLMKFDRYGDELDLDITKIKGVKKSEYVDVEAFNTMISRSEGIIEFDTRRKPCLDIIEKIAKMFPELTIRYLHAHDDVGTNTGEYLFKNGELVLQYDYEDRSKEAYEIYFSLWGEDDMYEYDENVGNYKIIQK